MSLTQLIIKSLKCLQFKVEQSNRLDVSSNYISVKILLFFILNFYRSYLNYNYKEK